ncbi:leucine rich repeat protein [Leptospira interrogans serovar Pomona str. Kennewicki LC82-25]
MEEVEPNTYMDLTETLQNPLDVRTLNLNGQKLKALPKKIEQLKNLQTLYLSNNQLTTLPKEKEKIRKLLPKCQIYFE